MKPRFIGVLLLSAIALSSHGFEETSCGHNHTKTFQSENDSNFISAGEVNYEFVSVVRNEYEFVDSCRIVIHNLKPADAKVLELPNDDLHQLNNFNSNLSYLYKSRHLIYEKNKYHHSNLSYLYRNRFIVHEKRKPFYFAHYNKE